MKEEYTWKNKYAWYVVDDEGRMMHPTKGYYSYHKECLDDWFDDEFVAFEALNKFYDGVGYVHNAHVLQKIYVRR